MSEYASRSLEAAMAWLRQQPGVTIDVPHLLAVLAKEERDLEDQGLWDQPPQLLLLCSTVLDDGAVGGEASGAIEVYGLPLPDLDSSDAMCRFLLESSEEGVFSRILEDEDGQVDTPIAVGLISEGWAVRLDIGDPDAELEILVEASSHRLSQHRDREEMRMITVADAHERLLSVTRVRGEGTARYSAVLGELDPGMNQGQVIDTIRQMGRGLRQ